MRHVRDQKLERLRQLPVFEHVDAKALRRLGASADDVHVRRGERIMREGAAFRDVYVVAGGSAVVTRQGNVVSRILPGEVIGEVALFCNCPASGDIEAATDLELLVIPANRFWSTLHDCSDLATGVASQLANQLLEVDDIHEGHHVH